jgi:hypothetical protein
MAAWTRRVALAGVLFALLACASSAPDETLASGAAPIIGGAADTTDGAVVAVIRISTQALCTGTLVAPDVVLTAGHCVFGIDPSDLEVDLGANITTPDATLTVRATAVYPGFDGSPDQIVDGVDLGALLLTQSVTTVTPVPIATSPLEAGALQGAEVTLVGFGADDGTASSGTGVRREVTLPVTTVCARTLRLGDADANACVGDSGGAVLLGGMLIAVIDGGNEGCEAPTVETRLDTAAPWIQSIVAGELDASCPACGTPDPTCSEAVGAEGISTDAGSSHHGGCALGRRGDPAGGSSMLLLVLAMVLGRRRSRPR